ncbi:MAG: hypothetical protein Q4F96_03205, partial [Bacillota bacterium]|nr:hypothetical protein [Bacillota bacterium]
MIRKWTAWLLAVCMIVTMTSALAFANDVDQGAPDPDQIVQEQGVDEERPAEKPGEVSPQGDVQVMS